MSSLQDRVVMVSGAGGFIGRPVVHSLLERGAKVRALLGPPGTQLPVTNSTNLKCWVGEITDSTVLNEVSRGAEIAIHLAGPPSVRRSFEHPSEFAQAHVSGTAALLEACRREGIRRFIQVSSAEVYGKTTKHNVDENEPLRPRSPYAAAKVGAEEFVKTFARLYNMPAVILRPFSVYGPGLSPDSLIGSIMQKAGVSDVVALHDFAPVRDFCYIDDVVDALMQSSVCDLQGIETFNIGTGRGTSIAALAEMIGQLFGRKIRFIEDPGERRPAGSDVDRLVANPSRARELLKWKAAIPLERGLAQTVSR